MQKKDIVIKDEQSNFKFNFRVAGMFINGNKILLQKCKKDNYYSLIGGRVKYGETTFEALKREIEEELGIKISKRNTKLTNVSENFFNYEGKRFHELLFIYKINSKQMNEIEEVKTTAYFGFCSFKVGIEHRQFYAIQRFTVFLDCVCITNGWV